VMAYVFYLFYQPPVHFKEASIVLLKDSQYNTEYLQLEQQYEDITNQRREVALSFAKADEDIEQQQLGDELSQLDQASIATREEVKELITKMDPEIETKDSDYVFLTFILNYLPHGLIGLLIAVIFSAAMSSTSSELNALASTTSIDFYKRLVQKDGSDTHYLNASKMLTFAWGVIAIIFAVVAKNSENLIEAVNIVGSIFYGTILGIFLVAFFFKGVKGNAVFYAALVAQTMVFVFHFLTLAEVITLGYLWYNAIGCLITILVSLFLQKIISTTNA
jgi:SSS family solute:Na+ symporter